MSRKVIKAATGTPRATPASGSITSSTRSSAWWDKSARPHHDTYVEPRITSQTKVTICPPRTPQEWLHGAA